jgi:hypothetical protein
LQFCILHFREVEMNNRRFSGYATVFCAFLTLAGSARAQDSTLSGTITDATDAVLPGATVTALHVATGNIFVAVSDTAGQYRIGAMRPGVYTIRAELSGFTTISRENVELLVGQAILFNVKMTLATVAESLTVTGQAPLIDTTQSKLGGNIDTRQVEALPVNGRNWMQLTMLAPGSRANDVGDAPTGLGGTTGGTGQRGDPGYFQLIVDGQQVTYAFAQATYGQPKIARDAIGEFQFLSSRFDATNGRSLGLVVNAVTKSGTNLFSGSGYGYFRDDTFIAKDFVAKRALPYSNQQFGGTLGGPLVKDKAHFFAYYEGEREPQTFTFQSPFPRFNIPDISETRIEHKAGGRVDVQLSPSKRLMVRGNSWRNHLPVDYVRYDSVVFHPSRALEQHWYRNDQLFTSFTQTFGNKSVNEIKAGVFRADSDERTPPGLEESPSIILRGYTLGSFVAALPLRLTGHTWSARDDFTTVVRAAGVHELKLGGDFLWNHNFLEWSTQKYGTLQANGGPIPANIEDLFPVWNDPKTWNLAPLSPITVRWTQSFPTCSTQTNGCGYTWADVPREASAWLQDNWAVTSRLTLNLGLRWDLAYNWAGQHLDFPPLHHKRGNEWTNIAPRLGFAYTLPDQRTVLRGGTGRYFIGAKDQWTHHIPANLQLAVVGVLNDGRPDFASNPFNGPPPTFEQAQALLHDTTGGVISDNVLMPYSYQTSLGVQRQLGETMSVQADYVWNAGRREQILQNTNLSYDPATGVNYPFSDISRRPWPFLGITQQYLMLAKSNYHGLETAFTKRFSRRWQASATYTLSSFRDYVPPPTSGLALVTFPVPEDIGNNWAYAQGDQRHRAVFNGIWELPFELQLSGLYMYGSGQVFPTNYGADLRNSGNAFLRLRPDGTIAPRDGVRGNPIHRTDLRVVRRFRIQQGLRAEASFEVFNVFNHVNYGNYVTVEASSLYGQPVQNLNVAYLPRMLQLGVRVMF